jgi:hypothetical protein
LPMYVCPIHDHFHFLLPTALSRSHNKNEIVCDE